MDDLRGRVAVVTGGAGGIGRALGGAFAGAGCRVVLGDVDHAGAEDAAAALRHAGAEAIAVAVDVRHRGDVEALAEAAEAAFGPVHVVCNNAGVVLAGESATASEGDWDFVMDVNFRGVVHGVAVFVPGIRAHGQGGHVVNTASMSGLVGMAGLGLYCASKFAVVGLSESLRRELAPEGIGVTIACPMVVDTAIAANSLLLRHGPGADAPATTLSGGVVAPDLVAERIVRAVRRDDLYVLTHPEQRALLGRRAARLDAACETDWPR